jgi:hypothetical protein
MDDATRNAADRVRAPMRLLRAERGLFDDDPVIPAEALRGFAATRPWVRVDQVADVNHYTLVMGGGPGPRKVADVIGESSLTWGRVK